MQTRRQFLFTLIAGLFVSGTEASLKSFQPSDYVDISNKLSSLVTNKNSALFIGKAYQSLPPQKTTDIPQEIFSLLQRINLTQKEFIKLEKPLVLQKIKNAIEQDFHTGNVELVNGWLLSKTEVKLCHVLSLIWAT
ncbi:MAG: hypothetical protein NTV43_04070 [Methylococcales bacterium]|nr:hypothetical protein [Methylococcales bacterium]